MSQSQELPGNAESAAAGPDEPERDLSARKMKRRRAQDERLQSRQEDLDWRKGMRQQDMDWRTGNRQEDVAWRQMEARRSSRCAALHAATHLASQGMSPAQVLELAEQFAAWIEIRGGHLAG